MDLTLQKLQTLSASELSKFSGSALFDIQQQTQRTYDQAKDDKDWIEAAIALKYCEKAQTIRPQFGKDTGVIHFEDENLYITEDLPKRVSWDQSKLSHIAQSIRAKGENVHEFLDMNYKVSEHKYIAWPERLRSLFQGARTLKTGKPVFRLSKHEEMGQ